MLRLDAKNDETIAQAAMTATSTPIVSANSRFMTALTVKSWGRPTPPAVHGRLKVVRRHVLAASHGHKAADNFTRPFQHASAGWSDPFIVTDG